MDFILGLMSQSVVPWRLVISRIGRIGHGELKGLNSSHFNFFYCGNFDYKFLFQEVMITYVFTCLVFIDISELTLLDID